MTGFASENAWHKFGTTLEKTEFHRRENWNTEREGFEDTKKEEVE